MATNAKKTTAPDKSSRTVEKKPPAKKLDKKLYEKELGRLQIELVKLQEWVKSNGLKVIVVFEGRDAAGKGGIIKRITECLSPRICRVAALPAPTDREKTQWYFQRYVAQLPAAGEIVLFDRSWYNRGGVERVMAFCTEEEYREFLRSCPDFERMLIRSGMILVKYWVSVSDEEQEARFQARIKDPTKRWKLSPMDLQSRSRWVEYSKAKDEMFKYTDIKQAPWYVVNSDDKRRARLNCISHLLSVIPYKDLTPEKIKLPPRQDDIGYVRPPMSDQTFIPEDFNTCHKHLQVRHRTYNSQVGSIHNTFTLYWSWRNMILPRQPISYVQVENSLKKILGGNTITESPVALTVNGQVWTTFMCTPVHLETMMIGFLLNEGILDSSDQVLDAQVCEHGDNVDIWLDHEVKKPESWTRTSGCTGGVTAVATIERPQPVSISEEFSLSPAEVNHLVQLLFDSQELYRETGGVHTSALSDGSQIILSAEDIGRHNTLDKIAGMALMGANWPERRILITTGRISSEMLQKAARMGAVFLISRTSPSSLSIELAEEWGITLIGYARRKRFNLYTHPERILSEEVQPS